MTTADQIKSAIEARILELDEEGSRIDLNKYNRVEDLINAWCTRCCNNVRTIELYYMLDHINNNNAKAEGGE